MDDDLSRLRRDLDTNPGDATLARRYEAALLRAGKRDEVQRLYQLEFRCPLRWKDLSERDPFETRERFCGQCERVVHFVETRAELQHHVTAGDCVAFERPVFEQVIEGLIEDPDEDLAQRAGRPCLLVEEAGSLPHRRRLETMGLVIEIPTPARSWLGKVVDRLRGR